MQTNIIRRIESLKRKTKSVANQRILNRLATLEKGVAANNNRQNDVVERLEKLEHVLRLALVRTDSTSDVLENNRIFYHVEPPSFKLL